jgi:hypothetical protein
MRLRRNVLFKNTAAPAATAIVHCQLSIVNFSGFEIGSIEN